MQSTLRAAVFVLLAGSLSAAAWIGSQGWSEVELELRPVKGKVHVLTGRGGNIGLSIGDDGVLMIDDQFAPLAERIEARILEIADERPSWLLNTHWHGDHVGGNEHFGAHATIVAHHNVRRRLAGDPELEGKVSDPPVEAPGLPVVTYDEGLSLHVNDEEVRVIHLPAGHTDGDSIVWFTGSQVAHLGDHFFSGNFPYVDLESGGSVQGYIENLDRIRELLPQDLTLIPGHGPVSSWEEFDDFREMVRECADRVRVALEAGRTPSEMIQSGLLEDLEERWGGGFMSAEGVIEIFARSLER